MTSDSMSARPTIIGTKILPDACGLRAIPSRAEPAARPWPMAPPRADRPMASAAARPSHLSRSARAASMASANAGLAVRVTAAATPRAKRETKDLEMRRMVVGLLLGFVFSGADLIGSQLEGLVLF